MENVSHIQYTNRNVFHCDFFGECSNNICLQSVCHTRYTNMASDCPVNDDEWSPHQVVQNVQQYQQQTHVSLNSLYMHTFDLYIDLLQQFSRMKALLKIRYKHKIS